MAKAIPTNEEVTHKTRYDSKICLLINKTY